MRFFSVRYYIPFDIGDLLIPIYFINAIIMGRGVTGVNLSVKALPRRELKFMANSPSPLKWTEYNSYSNSRN
jgi:hypothetical protein